MRAIPRSSPSLFAPGLRAAFVALALTLAPSAARPQGISGDTLRELSAAASDPERAEQAGRTLRRLIASHPGDPYLIPARQLLVVSLLTQHAPAAVLLGATDSTLVLLPPEQVTPRAAMAYAVAFELSNRGEQLPRARALAARGLAEAAAAGNGAGQLLAYLRGALGSIQAQLGEADSAIGNLSSALADLPPSDTGTTPRLLARLGQALESQGDADAALDSYFRSVGVYRSTDTTALSPLRALYAKRNGSLAGLDAKVAEARDKALRHEVFDSRRVDRPAPPWSLKDLNGKIVEWEQFKGKVVVIDFWGSWCGPCRLELPHFQALYDKYKGKGIAFLGINWESPGPAEQREKAARGFIAANGYTFPVLLDPEALAVQAYGVSSFPTVFMVDKQGVVRYRNMGFSEGIAEILEAQLKSLIEG